MLLSPEHKLLESLLKDTIMLLCKQMVSFQSSLSVHAVIGITTDKKDGFYLHFQENYTSSHECENVGSQQLMTSDFQGQTNSERSPHAETSKVTPTHLVKSIVTDYSPMTMRCTTSCKEPKRQAVEIVESMISEKRPKLAGYDLTNCDVDESFTEDIVKVELADPEEKDTIETRKMSWVVNRPSDLRLPETQKEKNKKLLHLIVSSSESITDHQYNTFANTSASLSASPALKTPRSSVLSPPTSPSVCMPYFCNICGLSFGTRIDCDDHIKKVHRKRSTIFCVRCESTLSSDNQEYRAHMLLHDSCRPFRCIKCQEMVSHKFCLRLVCAKCMSRYDCPAIKAWRLAQQAVCYRCGKKYSDKKALQCHISSQQCKKAEQSVNPSNTYSLSENCSKPPATRYVPPQLSKPHCSVSTSSHILQSNMDLSPQMSTHTMTTSSPHTSIERPQVIKTPATDDSQDRTIKDREQQSSKQSHEYTVLSAGQHALTINSTDRVKSPNVQSEISSVILRPRGSELSLERKSPISETLKPVLTEISSMEVKPNSLLLNLLSNKKEKQCSELDEVASLSPASEITESTKEATQAELVPSQESPKSESLSLETKSLENSE